MGRDKVGNFNGVGQLAALYYCVLTHLCLACYHPSLYCFRQQAHPVMTALACLHAAALLFFYIINAQSSSSAFSSSSSFFIGLMPSVKLQRTVMAQDTHSHPVLD